jgi:ABC-type antimicrobial peptide transport system permease subunit
MRTGDLISQTLGTIRDNKSRTALTILGIVIGIASVILMLALGSGAQAQVQEQIASVGAQIVNVSVDDSHFFMTPEDVDALRQSLPNTEAVSGVLQASGEAVFDGDTHAASFYAADEFYATVEGFTYVTGRYFTPEEFEQRQRVILISKSFAEDLFGTGNAAVALGQNLNIKGSNYSIVGVLDSQGSAGFSMGGAVYFPYGTFVSMIDHVDTVTVIAVRATDVESIPALKPFVLALLNVRHGRPTDDDVFKASDLTSVLETASQVTEIFTLLLAAIASISLVVGGIGIMNMMLTNVTERTREIGVRKALGAQRREITMQFLVEAILLTFLGGVIGILVGVGLSTLIGTILPFKPVVTVGAVLLSTLFSVGVGLFFGYYPATKAASLNPIEALRHE